MVSRVPWPVGRYLGKGEQIDGPRVGEFDRSHGSPPIHLRTWDLRQLLGIGRGRAAVAGAAIAPKDVANVPHTCEAILAAHGKLGARLVPRTAKARILGGRQAGQLLVAGRGAWPHPKEEHLIGVSDGHHAAAIGTDAHSVDGRVQANGADVFHGGQVENLDGLVIVAHV